MLDEPRVASPHMLQTSFYRGSRGASPPDAPRSSFAATHHRKQASNRKCSTPRACSQLNANMLLCLVPYATSLHRRKATRALITTRRASAFLGQSFELFTLTYWAAFSLFWEESHGNPLRATAIGLFPWRARAVVMSLLTEGADVRSRLKTGGAIRDLSTDPHYSRDFPDPTIWRAKPRPPDVRRLHWGI